MRAILFIFVLLLYPPAYGYCQELLGTVTDNRKEPLINASVTVMQGGKKLSTIVTDYDGKYNIKQLAPGIYDATVSYVGCESKTWTGILITPAKTTELNFRLRLINSTKPLFAPEYRTYPPNPVISGGEIYRKLVTYTPDDLVAIPPSIFIRPYIDTNYKATYIVDAKPEITHVRRRRWARLFVRY